MPVRLCLILVRISFTLPARRLVRKNARMMIPKKKFYGQEGLFSPEHIKLQDNVPVTNLLFRCILIEV
jgi:hypothetical protein